MTTQELWRATLGELELSLTKANFTTWFKQTFIFSFQGGEVIVAVPSNFYKTWLERKYHKTIVTVLQNLCPEPIKNLSYKVETHQKPPEDIVFTCSVTVQVEAARPAIYSPAPAVVS